MRSETRIIILLLLKHAVLTRLLILMNTADPFIMYAAERGYTRACKILINKGADPLLKALEGITAIMFASYGGYENTVRLLLKHGVDPDIQAADGFTSLMVAAQNGHLGVVRLLLNRGRIPI